VVASALPLAAQTDDPANDPRVQEAASQLLCYCGCNTQSVADCACDVAQKERAKILARLDAGATPAQVVAEWVEQRGTGILIQPPAEGFNLLGWWLPGVVLLAAALLLGLQVRRWSRERRAAAAPPPAAPEADPRMLERLQRDLEALDR
jgi:cytochrome c-type biogenesis protein CcmH